MITWVENLMRNIKALQRVYYAVPDPLKGLILNLRAIPLVKLRYSKETFKYLEKLMNRDKWTCGELLDFVEEQLKNTIEIAKGIPYYKDIANKASSINDFPILIRDEVRNNYASMVNLKKRPLVRVFTSGTSGSGLPAFFDKKAYFLNWAYLLKHRIWGHVSPRDWRITFFGSRVIPLNREKPPFWMKNNLEHQYLVSIFHISEKHIKHYIRFLDEHQGLVLEGFPTVLYLIARYVKALRSKLEFKAVFSTGEPLYPFIRKEIEQAFGSKVYDTYGMTEWAGLILECERGGYHVITDYGYLEILKDNRESAGIGEEGYLIWTGFINSAMPLIRYSIGDKGIWQEGRCTCGRPYPLVNPTITRDSDYLITPSGRLLSPRAVNQALKDKVSFKACQFIQEREDEIVVRVVPDRTKDFRSEIIQVKKATREMIGKDVFIEEEIAEEPIRRGNQGKIPLIISKVNNEGFNRCKTNN